MQVGAQVLQSDEICLPLSLFFMIVLLQMFCLCVLSLSSYSPLSVQNLNNTVLLLLHLADTLRQQNMLMNVRLDMDVRNLSMVVEEMKLVDVRHIELIKNFTILKGTVDIVIYKLYTLLYIFLT